MNIQKSNLNVNGVSFSGHSKSLDSKGKVQHSFYYLYDPSKYDCEVELYNIRIPDTQYKLNVEIMDDNGPACSVPMPPEGLKISIPQDERTKAILTNTKDGLGFAYRFKLSEIERDANGVPIVDENGKHKIKKDEKGNPKVSYAFDNGDVIGIRDKEKSDNKYNIVFSNRAIINKNGPMQLIMPDEYNPGVIKGANGITVGEALRGQALIETQNKPVKTEQDIANLKRTEALESVRTHANKLGGSFYGIIARLGEIKNEGISRIVGTPYTKDTVSSHLYWTENAYQVAPDLGTEEDFKELQRHLFSNGINWIADAALVNEGLGGVHLNAVLRNGQNSYAANMFHGSNQKLLGILPNRTEVSEKHTKMKIINAPFIVKNSGDKAKIVNNTEFDKNKPTYIQFYDDRLASDEQIKSNSPEAMKTYAKKNTNNIYDITRHDDAVYPFALEVDPGDLRINIERAIENNKGRLSDSSRIDYDDIPVITEFPNFQVVPKREAGGLELWDGNVDIAKLNFFLTDKDYKGLNIEQKEAYQRGALSVKDYAINSGRYWTQLTTDTQLEFISKELSKYPNSVEGYSNAINSLIGKGIFPESAQNIDETIIENVLDGSYHLRKLKDADARSEFNPEIKIYNGQKLKENDYKPKDYILKKALDTPLETLPIANNLMSIVTSPYIVQKPISKEELGVSKYDLTRKRQAEPDLKYDKTTSKVTQIYESRISPIIFDIVKDIKYKDTDGRFKGIFDRQGNVSEYGRYVLSEITPDLTRYILTKSLVLASDRDAKEINNIINFDEVVSEDGHFDFSKVDEESITMQSLGIPYKGQENYEAQIVIDSINKGLNRFPEEELSELKQKVAARFMGTDYKSTRQFTGRTLNDFKVAEMIHDRTESGLGWRIDAAKDVASIDSVREGTDTITHAWDNVIEFWKTYNQTVLKENPHAYTTAEITDLNDFIGGFNPEDKYMSDADAERKFIEQTGITSVANYNYFFSLIPALYSPFKFEDGNKDEISWMSKQDMSHELREKLDKGWNDNPGFLFQSPEDGVVNSYTFMGNHDKPRVLHCLAMDMHLFHGGLKSLEHKKIAYQVLNPDNKEEVTEELIENSGIDFDKLDSKAIAMAQRIDYAIDDIIREPALNKKLKHAAANLATGNYKGEKFPAGAFGTRPFEIAIKTVLDQAEYNNIDEKISDREEIEANLRKDIMAPAFEKFLYMYKLLITLPGSPTDFAGDKEGLSGYETKAKNYHQQNRNVIPWEYLKEENKETYGFILDFYNKMNEISNLRTKPELSALNDGATVSIPVTGPDGGNSTGLQAMLRYNDKGSVVISLHTNAGANTSKKSKFDDITLEDMEQFNRNPLEKKTVSTSTDNSQNNRIILNPDIANVKQGLKHGIDLNSVFRNARNLNKDNKIVDNSIYKFVKMTDAQKGKDYYCLKKFNSTTGKEEPISITPEDLNSLILYKVN